MAEDSKFITTNTDGSFLTYNKRIIYNGTVITDQAQYKNLIDFNFGEKFLYGRVSSTYVPMCARCVRKNFHVQTHPHGAERL